VSKFRARTKPQDLLGIRQQTEADVQMSCKLANGVIYTLLKPGMAQGSCPPLRWIVANDHSKHGALAE
jgi:hypothetical protein